MQGEADSEGIRKHIRSTCGRIAEDMEVIKLYEDQSYLRENTTMIERSYTKDGRYYAVLKETIFFPEEGGQYSDTGWLETEGKKISLKGGQVNGDEVIYELSEPAVQGAEVRCILDWEQRYMRMQQHTGEHLLTGVIHNTFGYNNAGFHLSDDAPVTLDLDGVLTKEQAMEMETLANEAVYRNLTVKAVYPSKEELKSISYRSKIEIDGQVRLIVIDGVDVCACCAPHTSRTGEVGIIKIVSMQNYKGGTRLSILCGKRALIYFREQSELMDGIAGSLSTRPDQVAGIIAGQKEEIMSLRSRLSGFRESQLLDEIERLTDRKNAVVFADADTPVNVMKNIYNRLVGRFPGYCGIFAGNDESGYRYNAGSAELDSRELAAKMREGLNAKGGGSREMIQGKTTADRKCIEAFFENPE